MKTNKKTIDKASKAPAQPRRKYAAPAPLNSRASRSEGAGAGPKRSRPRDK